VHFPVNGLLRHNYVVINWVDLGESVSSELLIILDFFFSAFLEYIHLPYFIHSNQTNKDGIEYIVPEVTESLEHN